MLLPYFLSRTLFKRSFTFRQQSDDLYCMYCIVCMYVCTYSTLFSDDGLERDVRPFREHGLARSEGPSACVIKQHSLYIYLYMYSYC